MREITIIGLGQVGSNLAAQLLANRSVDQLDLLDQSDERANGVATDLGDAYPDAAISSQDWTSVSRADVVVVALGKRDLLADDRFGELTYNAQAIHALANKFADVDFPGVVLNLANPNEASTAFIQQEWRLQPKQTIGIGTVVDTARLRRTIADKLGLSFSAVTGFVDGQHDGNLVMPWSTWRVNGQTLAHPVMGKTIDQQQAAIESRMKGFTAIKGLQSDWTAMVAWASRVINAILADSGDTYPLAINQPQFGGYVSFPVQIGRQGVGNYVLLPLDELEKGQIKVAANAINTQLAAMQASI